MQPDVIHYKPHTLSLGLFKFFSQLLHRFLQLQSCFIKWYKKERNMNGSPLLYVQNWRLTENFEFTLCK